MPNTLLEIWQANACGPLHPSSISTMRRSIRISSAAAVPDGRRRLLQFHGQARRLSLGQPSQRLAANHIHFSLFGPCFVARLVTQMYFPGDPLFAFDPIFNASPTAARNR